MVKPVWCRWGIRVVGFAVLLLGLMSFSGGSFARSQLVSTTAPTLYISSSGSDTSTCTNEASPCESLAYATTQASPGSTIDILYKAYLNTTPSQTPFTIPRSLSPLSIITSTAYGSLTPTPAEAGTIYGSGMVVPKGMDLTITGISIANFTTQDGLGGGGALYVDQGANVTLDDCLLVQNQAIEVPTSPGSYASGGAILNQGTVHIIDSALKSNTVTTPAQVSTPGTLQGGALYNLGTMSLVKTILTGNGLYPTANQSYTLAGGGILNAGTLSLMSSTVDSNGINVGSGMANSSLRGGGIANVGGLTIVDSEIANNTILTKTQGATLQGAGVFNSGVLSELALSTIILNDSVGLTNPAGVGLTTTTVGSFGTQAPVSVAGTVIGMNAVNGTSAVSNCSATGSGAEITSLGYNVTDNTDCGFSSATDVENTTLTYIDNPTNFSTTIFEPVGPNPWAYAIPPSASVVFGSSSLLLCPGVDQLGMARPQPGQSNCSAGSVEPGKNQVSPTPPVFTSPSVAFFTVGQSGSFNVAASGTPTPIYTIANGTLPQGLTLNEVTGQLSGTPALGTEQSAQLSIVANNGTGTTATQSLSVVVEPIPVTISSNALVAGSRIDATATVTPNGSSISPTGTMTFTAKAKNQALGTCTAAVGPLGQATCTLSLSNVPSGVASAELGATYTPQSPDLGATSTQIGSFPLSGSVPTGIITGTVGTQLPSGSLGAELITPASSVTWSDASGSLPKGVAVDPTTGAFSGTPLSAGSYVSSLQVSADGALGNLAVPITLSIAQAQPHLTLSLPAPTSPGTATTVSATITGPGPLPTGTVTFHVGGTDCVGTLSNGSASCTLSAPDSTQTLTASYGGDANYLGTSATTTLTVPAPSSTAPPGGSYAGSTGQSSSLNPLSQSSGSSTGALVGVGAGGVVLPETPSPTGTVASTGSSSSTGAAHASTTPTSVASSPVSSSSTGGATNRSALGATSRRHQGQNNLVLVLALIGLVVIGAGLGAYRFWRVRGGAS
jgi:hypothetical protein